MAPDVSTPASSLTSHIYVLYIFGASGGEREWAAVSRLQVNLFEDSLDVHLSQGRFLPSKMPGISLACHDNNA